MNLRDEIIALARRYARERQTRAFVPGETYVPVSGKVLDEDDLAHLVDASLDMWLTAGRFAEDFERRLARKLGVRKSLLTVSGSAANLLAFSALTSPRLGAERIEPGSEVITVAAGFPTTVNPIIQNRCVPVFVDVELTTHNIDVRYLEEALSPKTRALMVAHTLGNPFDLGTVCAFCKAHGLYLIEDTCDAFGARYDGRLVGTFGELGTLSFYPAHHITMGEGGAVFFEKPKYERIVASFRDWGRDCWCDPGKDNTCGKRFDWELGSLPPGYDHKYIYSHIGYNVKATDMQAAVGCSQLEKVDGFIERRRKNHAFLHKAFVAEKLDQFFVLPEPTPRSEPSWFGFVLTVRADSGLQRNEVVQYLESRKIGTRLVFGGNLVKQPAYEGAPMRIVGELNATDRVMNDSFWVGVWPGLDEGHLAYMVDTFKTMVQQQLR